MESSSSFVQHHAFLDVLLQPLSKFLSDSIGKQSAMSKRGQDMAKPKQAVPAKVRPMNLVLHSPWSARENPSQNLGYPVNPRNDDKGQGDLTRTRKLVQTTQNPEVERSQVQIFGNSTIRRKLRTLVAQGNLCKQQLQERNFKIWSLRTISTWQRSSNRSIEDEWHPERARGRPAA